MHQQCLTTLFLSCHYGCNMMLSCQSNRVVNYRTRFATFYSTRTRNITSDASPDGVWCITAIVCENQRFHATPHPDNDTKGSDKHWSSDYLTRADWPALSDISGTCSLYTLQSVELLDGYRWADEWSVEIRPNQTDWEGYYYASCFEDLCEQWWDEDDMRIVKVEIMADRDKLKSVRSKCWHRHMVGAILAYVPSFTCCLIIIRSSRAAHCAHILAGACVAATIPRLTLHPLRSPHRYPRGRWRYPLCRRLRPCLRVCQWT